MTSRLACVVAFASTLTTISGVSSGNLTAVSATIVWSTDVPADSRVEYGPTVSYGSQTTLNTAAVTSHSQGLSSLAPSTLYHFRVHSRDGAGNLATSGDFSFTTAPDNVAPMTPGGLSGSAVSASQINLSWAPAGDNVGVTGYAIRRNGVVIANTAGTSFPSSGLTPNTRYTYAVRAIDAAGNISNWSADFSVTTPTAPDATPPAISAVSSNNLTAVSATIVWTTNEPADARVEYGPTVSYGSQTTLNTAVVTSHSQGLSGLAPSRLYHFRVHSRDAAGNLASSGDFSFTTAADHVAPMTPAGLSGSAVSASQINLAWPASGDNVGVTGYAIRRNGVVIANTAGTSFQNTGLAPNTRYTYAVRAVDAAGNISNWSADFSVTTPTPPDATPPALSAVSSVSITASGATIVWTTNEPADTRVEYGPTISYGSQTTLNTAAVTSHSQALSGLEPNTLYHFRVHSRDAAGNLATSGDFSFTTRAAPDSERDAR